MALELASPFFPSAFLLLMSAGSILRSMTGVAGGATRAALTQHFALRRNAADIAAKEQVGGGAGRRGWQEGLGGGRRCVCGGGWMPD
jgi:hypothetical protein